MQVTARYLEPGSLQGPECAGWELSQCRWDWGSFSWHSCLGGSSGCISVQSLPTAHMGNLPRDSNTSSSWRFPTSHPWQVCQRSQVCSSRKIFLWQQHFSPLRRRVIEPQCLQAKTTSTEDKTALVHQSLKQYRGEFLIFLNCHLETIHHPLLKLSGGGWVTSRDSRFMCKLWWEHVYCCATCTWYCSFLASKQSERVRKGGIHTAGLKNLLRTHSELCTSCEERVCPCTHREVSRERRAGMWGWEDGEWLHSSPQCTVTGPSGVDFTLGFCKLHFCHFGWAIQVQVFLEATAGWLPLHRGFSKGGTDFFAHILKYLWKCWRLLFSINQSSTWQLRFFSSSGSCHCILTKEDYHLSIVCLTEIKHNPFPCPPAVHSEIWTPSPQHTLRAAKLRMSWQLGVTAE